MEHARNLTVLLEPPLTRTIFPSPSEFKLAGNYLNLHSLTIIDERQATRGHGYYQTRSNFSVVTREDRYTEFLEFSSCQAT